VTQPRPPDEAGAHAQLDRFLKAGGTSLGRLGLDTVDLYQVHAYDALTPLEETLRTLDRFVRAGKIRYWGLSNFTGWQLTKAVHLARALNVAAPVTIQPQYSLLARETEWEIVPAALDAGLGLLPWSPLGGGWLSGKYQRDQRPAGATRLGEDPNRGMEACGRRGTDRTWRVIDATARVAEDRGASMAEVAIAWVTARPAVSSTSLGARTMTQLEANLSAAGLRLSAAETAALDAASDPQAGPTTPTANSAWTSAPAPCRRPASRSRYAGSGAMPKRKSALADDRGIVNAQTSLTTLTTAIQFVTLKTSATLIFIAD
jgi:aryl-alcohol dehydrogenase-like predicted oxidoreductase